MTSALDRRQSLEALLMGEGVARANPPLLLGANVFFDLAGEEFGQRLLLTNGADGIEYCIRPDFTLPIADAYLASGAAGQPAAFGYIGPIFRQRLEGPSEIEQAGLELLAQRDPDAALDQVFTFAFKALAIFGVADVVVKVGSVALFEGLLAAIDIPDVWRPRIRYRFGHPEAMARLLDRLADPHGAKSGSLPWKRNELVSVVTDQMVTAGLSLSGGRTPEEVADRYFEKQQMAAARIPPESVALLRNYLGVSGEPEAALRRVSILAEDQGINLSAIIARTRQHMEALAAEGAVGTTLFDAGFSPRLDYYTGIVFQVTGLDGHVLASGGEYDRLLERLGASQRISASGCALWVERLEEAAQ